MPAYLLLVLAILTRVVPHHGWLNFTAVGGALLYFGARRPRREMLAPMAALMVTDYCLTVFAYHYSFEWKFYVTTWAWYLAVMALGYILLKSKTTWLRAGAAAILGPTSFWLISNYSVWVGGTMYPRTLGGLATCYAAAIPFYRNDLVATAIVVGVAFGVPVLVRKLGPERDTNALAVR
ncbi:hypothetical protein P8935_10290 [Telmatobacter sp. DSM 110680]|uniref:Lysoplasmalogenase n=1 Tax=Telmatobacter sp. DSM 110680 TaxID=3036704 RepID=A0AAU7DRM1_9BACT